MKTRISQQGVLLFVISFCLTGGLADGRQVKTRNTKEEVDPACRPKDIENLRDIAEPTKITVEWNQFHATDQCTKHGAKYVIIITWTEDGELMEDEIEAHNERHTITDLTPYTDVNITVYLRYSDESGDTTDGPVATLYTRTAVDKPSLPRKLSVAEFRQQGSEITVSWEEPEVPNGPLDGYTYTICPVKSCEEEPDHGCKEARDVQGLSIVANRLAPLQYYWVWLAGYNEDENKVKVVGNYAPLCFRAPPAAVDPARDVEVTCASGPNTVTVTWKLLEDAESRPESYKVEVIGPVAGLEKVSHDVDINTQCKEEVCTHNVGGGKGGHIYEVTLSPHYKDVGPFGTRSVVENCIMPESAPPTPTKEIKVVNDPSLSKTQQALEVPKGIFSDENGPITTIEWLIAHEKQIENCGALVTWKESHSNDSVRCYVVRPDEEDTIRGCNESGNVYKCVLGSDLDCEGDKCNGPLQVGVMYGAKLRAYTKMGRADTKPVFFKAGYPSSSGKISGSILLVTVLTALKAFMV